MRKIGIVGYGAATIGYLYGIFTNSVEKDLQITIFDSNRQQNAGGLGGLAYDGKLVIGSYAGSDINNPIQLQEQLLKFFINNSNSEQHKYDKNDQIIEQWRNKFYESGMQLVSQKTNHLGTDQLANVNTNILS